MLRQSSKAVERKRIERETARNEQRTQSWERIGTYRMVDRPVTAVRAPTIVSVPKYVQYRSRVLLDLAHRDDAECGNCGKRGPCEPAHSNASAHGKGKSVKADDCFVADLCHDCHAWLDQGIGSDPTGVWSDSRADKQGMWRAAFDFTLRRRFQSGLYKVAK